MVHAAVPREEAPAAAHRRLCVCVCSWGSGADLWGSEVDSRYGKPRIDDGLLEVVGVTGVVHMVRSNTHTRTRPQPPVT